MSSSVSILEAVQEIVGIRFRNLNLLQEALTHRSYLNESRISNARHNERLEFLGDVILEFIVSVYLFKEYPSFSEGELTQLRSALVNLGILAAIGEELALPRYIRMSKGQQIENEQLEQSRKRITGAAVEAMLGAIFLDRGIGTAELFCLEFLLPRLEKIRKERSFIDPKSHLQDIAQSRLKITPHYVVLQEEGPEHAKVFTVTACLGDREIGKGTGGSKKLAETEAAIDALSREFGIEFSNQ